MKWVKSKKGYITSGGDLVWECGNCGYGEHVYGIESINNSKRYCPDCGSENTYPWILKRRGQRADAGILSN